MDQAEPGVGPFTAVPAAHRPCEIHFFQPLGATNKVQTRANVVGIFPNETSIRRLIGAVMMEQNEGMAITTPLSAQHTMVDTVTETGGLYITSRSTLLPVGFTLSIYTTLTDATVRCRPEKILANGFRPAVRPHFISGCRSAHFELCRLISGPEWR